MSYSHSRKPDLPVTHSSLLSTWLCVLFLAYSSSQYDILLCSETLVSDMHHVSEMLFPSFCHPVLLCRARCLVSVGWLYMFEMVTEHFAKPNLSVVVEKCLFLGFVV